MEFWVKDRTESGKGEEGVIIKGGNRGILSVAKVKDGFKFTEECDGYYSETYSKEDALKLLDELKDWINK